MRFINTVGFNPRGWKPDAQIKTKQLIERAALDQEKVFLDANITWPILRPSLERLSHNKCWFSEAYASVSDFQVEHFRPKKRIHLIKSKDPYPEKRTATCPKGYWWLSYELENLRLAGGKPNQQKGTYFPLETNSIIATALNNSWRREHSILLDPCVKRDTELITFDGTEPTPSNPNPITLDHIRARISIEIYGLKHRKLKMARSRVLEEAKNYYSTGEKNWIAMNVPGASADVINLAQVNLSDACTNLVSMLKPNREFTKMIYAFLKGMNKEWINDYVIEIARTRKYLH